MRREKRKELFVKSKYSNLVVSKPRKKVEEHSDILSGGKKNWSKIYKTLSNFRTKK